VLYWGAAAARTAALQVGSCVPWAVSWPTSLQARTGWAGSIMVLKPSTMGAGLFTEKGGAPAAW